MRALSIIAALDFWTLTCRIAELGFGGAFKVISHVSEGEEGC
jgi:hypothetical protein